MERLCISQNFAKQSDCTSREFCEYSPSPWLILLQSCGIFCIMRKYMFERFSAPSAQTAVFNSCYQTYEMDLAGQLLRRRRRRRPLLKLRRRRRHRPVLLDGSSHPAILWSFSLLPWWFGGLEVRDIRVIYLMNLSIYLFF